MIDWEATRLLSGVTPDSIKTKSQIICHCECGEKCRIRNDKFILNIKKNGHYLCKICTNKRIHASEEYKQKISEANKKTKNTADGKTKASIASKIVWNDQTRRDTASITSKEKWADPQYRLTTSEAAKAATTREDFKLACAERSKSLWTQEQYRSATLSAMLESVRSPERRAKQAQITKKLWESDEFRAKLANKVQPRISSLQIALYGILDGLEITYEKESEKTVLGPFCFDCLIPRTDGHRHLLIECQGEYWHSKEEVSRRDRSKFTYVDRYFPEYEIMYLWEHEFHSPDRVLDRLRSKLGLDKGVIDFSLDGVTVSEVTYKDVTGFLDAYHYLGGGRGGKCLGAMLNGELIACALFSSPTRQNTIKGEGLPVLELARFCIHPRRHRKNFASWFLGKAVKSLVRPVVVVAYADTTVGHDGTIYRAGGFELHHEVPIDYWYVGEDKWVMHKKTLYNRAVRLGCKESEYAERFGYVKRWGGIKYCYVRRLP